MSEDRRLLLQGLGCLVVVALILTSFARTYRTQWRLWLAAFLAVVLGLWIWGWIQRRRIRKLDAQYGLSIIYNHRDDAWVQAFHQGVPAFTIPLYYDETPPRADFTAALPAIPAADRQLWRRRLTEYLQHLGRYQIS